MSKKLRTLLVIAIIVIAIIVIVTKFDNNQRLESYTIGVAVDLTGPMAINGQWAKEGIDLAYDDLKLKNNHIKLIISDSRGESKTAVSLLEKLINVDKTKVIIAANASSSDIMAMAPISEKNESILFVTTASSPSIANAGDFIFRNRLSGEKEVEAVVKAAANREINQIALATLNNQAGHAYAGFFEDAIHSYNLTIPVKEWINLEETNFKIHATKLKGSKADAVFYAGPIKLGALLMKSCAEIGYNPIWLGISAMRSKELFELAGDIADGLIIATEFPDTSSSKYKELSHRYQDKYNGEPNTFTVNAFDALTFLSTAIDSVGYDPIKIRDFLYCHSFSGAGGEMKFDKNGDAIRKVQLMQVKDSKFVLIEN